MVSKMISWWMLKFKGLTCILNPRKLFKSRKHRGRTECSRLHEDPSKSLAQRWSWFGHWHSRIAAFKALFFEGFLPSGQFKMPVCLPSLYTQPTKTQVAQIPCQSAVADTSWTLIDVNFSTPGIRTCVEKEGHTHEILSALTLQIRQVASWWWTKTKPGPVPASVLPQPGFFPPPFLLSVEYFFFTFVFLSLWLTLMGNYWTVSEEDFRIVFRVCHEASSVYACCFDNSSFFLSLILFVCPFHLSCFSIIAFNQFQSKKCSTAWALA